MRLAAGLAVAIALSAVGCGRATTAHDKICRDINMVQNAVTTIRGLDPTKATVEDLRTANRSMNDSVQLLKEDAKSAKLTGVDNLAKAQTNLSNTINAIPGGTTFTAAMKTIGPALTTVEQTGAALSKGLACPVK
jgi:hypothetical protein